MFIDIFLSGFPNFDYRIKERLKYLYSELDEDQNPINFADGIFALNDLYGKVTIEKPLIGVDDNGYLSLEVHDPDYILLIRFLNRKDVSLVIHNMITLENIHQECDVDYLIKLDVEKVFKKEGLFKHAKRILRKL